jgi:ribosome-associated protein
MISEPSDLPENPDPLRVTLSVMRERKAIDPRVLYLKDLSGFTDYFVICSGATERQVEAIAEGVRRQLSTIQVKLLHSEGSRNGLWILLDFGEFVVHVFKEEARRFYGLDSLWSDAPDLTVELDR